MYSHRRTQRTALLIAMLATSLTSVLNANDVVLENEHIRVVVDPTVGGRITSFVEKASGIEFTHFDRKAKPGSGLLCDRLWGRRQHRGMEYKAYEIVKQTKDSITLRIVHVAKQNNAFVIEKTIRLPKDRASVLADYSLANVGTSNWEGRLWICNVLRPDSAADEPITFQYPTSLFSSHLGRADAKLGRWRFDYLPGGDSGPSNKWISKARSGWMTVTRQDGVGAALLVDRGYLQKFYSYQPPSVAEATKLATTEVLFGPLLLRPTDDDEIRDRIGIPPLVGQTNPGVPFKAQIEIVPFRMPAKQIVDARDGLIFGATSQDRQVNISAYSATRRSVDAAVKLRSMHRDEAAGPWSFSATLEPGNPVTQQFVVDTPITPSRVLTVTADKKVMTLPTFAEKNDTLGYEEKPTVALKKDFEPAIDYPEIDDGPRTKHVKWHKPLAERPRILLVLSNRSRRDLPELLQRMDADVDTVVIAFPHYFTYSRSPVGTDPYRVLNNYLQYDHDVIVLGGGVYWQILPEEDRKTIFEKVQSGTGLVYIAPDSGNRLFSKSQSTGVPVADLLSGETIPGAADEITRGIPRKRIPVFRQWQSLAEHVRVSNCGEGTVINYDASVWPYGKPYLVRQSLRPFVTRAQQEDVAFDYDEYHWLLTQRMITYAAGKPLPVHADVTLDTNLQANLKLTGGNGNASITARWFNRRGEIIGSTTNRIDLPASTHNLKPKLAGSVLPGDVLVNVLIHDSAGNVIGNTAAIVTYASTSKITRVDTTQFGYQPGEPVHGSIETDGQLPDGAKLNLQVSDMHGRLLADQSVPLKSQASRNAQSTKHDGPVNLLPNGNFETDGEGAGKLPTGWARAGTNQLSTIAIDNNARIESTGKRAMRVTTTPNALSVGVMSPKIPIDANKPLTVSGWVKASGEETKGAGGYVGVHWYDAQQRPIRLRKNSGHNYTYVISAYRKPEWQHRQIVFNPVNAEAESYSTESIPYNAAFCEIRAFSLEYQAPVWFDDITATQPSDKPLANAQDTTTATHEYAFLPRSGLTQLHRIDVQLVDADGHVLDTGWTEFAVDLPIADDVTFQVWGPNNAPGTVSGELEIQSIVKTGFDYATVGASSAPPNEVREYMLGLMRHGLRAMPMTLMHIGADRQSIGTPIRQPCLTDPAFRRHQMAGLQAYTEKIHDLSPPAYFNGDENSLGSYSKPHDFCQSPSCLARFRGVLQQQYGSIKRLNKAWGTTYADWQAIVPPTLAQARDQDKWAPWIVHRAYMPSVLADSYGFMHKAIKRGRPLARLATSGMGRPTLNNGFDWPQLMPHLDHAALYARQHSHLYRAELFRDYSNPGAALGTWTGYGAPQGFVRDSFWWEVLNGFSCPAYYASLEYLMTFGMAQSEDAKVLANDIAEIKSGYGKLIVGAARQQDAIAIHHSYLSAVALESIRQQTGTSLGFDDYYAGLDGYIQIIKELGYQSRMVDRRDLEAGKLNSRTNKVLIMPLAHAVSDAELAAVQEFVEAGGTLITDPSFAYLNDSGRHMDRPLVKNWLNTSNMDQSFNWINNQRPTVTPIGKGRVISVFQPIWDYPRLRAAGRERLMRDGVADQLASAGIKQVVRVTAGSTIGNAVWNGEVVRLSIGEGQIVALRRNYMAHPDGTLQSTDLTADWDKPMHSYDIRKGVYLGHQDSWQGTLNEGGLIMLALLPDKVSAPKASVAFDSLERGQDAIINVRQATADKHALHLSVTDPNGTQVQYLAQNAWLSDQHATFRVPHALNDAKGQWQATIRNVVTGQTADVSWQLR